MRLIHAWRVYKDPKLLAILCLGFSSGLPLALTASTLGLWLTEAGVSMSAIGLFAAITMPYALKFLWSPLIDAMSFPMLCKWLGRRRGWMIAIELALMVSIVGLGLTNPATDPWMTALMALCVTFFSASQDIVIDGYRIEILEPQEQGAGAAAAVLGYRIGMIASTTGAIFLDVALGWSATYDIMAALIGVGMAAALLTGEPKESVIFPASGNWFREHVVAPFADFMQRDGWLAILLFVVLFKLSDAFMGVMTNPFLLTIGFSKIQIGIILKFYGVIATIIGSLIGGAMVFRLGMLRSLWICAVVHALTNLMFVVQAKMGADAGFLAASITLENISGGMGTAAFVAFLSNLTHARFTATQYALLSSLAAVGRTVLSTPAGWVSEQLGWEGFFLFSTALAIPGLILLWWMGQRKFLD